MKSLVLFLIGFSVQNLVAAETIESIVARQDAAANQPSVRALSPSQASVTCKLKEALLYGARTARGDLRHLGHLYLFTKMPNLRPLALQTIHQDLQESREQNLPVILYYLESYKLTPKFLRARMILVTDVSGGYPVTIDAERAADGKYYGLRTNESRRSILSVICSVRP